jgi:hypothetical protein
MQKTGTFGNSDEIRHPLFITEEDITNGIIVDKI